MELTILAEKLHCGYSTGFLIHLLNFKDTISTANNLFRLYIDLVTLTVTFTDTRKTIFFEC